MSIVNYLCYVVGKFAGKKYGKKNAECEADYRVEAFLDN